MKLTDDECDLIHALRRLDRGWLVNAVRDFKAQAYHEEAARRGQPRQDGNRALRLVGSPG